MISPIKKYKAFVSYAHADKLYFDILMKGIRVHSNGLDVDWDIWEDSKIPIGEDWHKFIQQKVNECDFAVLFISGNFLFSDYISNSELKKFIIRDYSEDFFIFPILIDPCNFQKDRELAKKQFFICNGDEYGCPNIQDLTYADLVRITSEGKILPNPNRERYHLNLVGKIASSIKHNKII
jgi:hypothetical protein